jgi:hypothetical protein
MSWVEHETNRLSTLWRHLRSCCCTDFCGTNKPHVEPRRDLTDRFRIVGIIILRLHIRLDELWRHQSTRMPKPPPPHCGERFCSPRGQPAKAAAPIESNDLARFSFRRNTRRPFSSAPCISDLLRNVQPYGRTLHRPSSSLASLSTRLSRRVHPIRSSTNLFSRQGSDVLFSGYRFGLKLVEYAFLEVGTFTQSCFFCQAIVVQGSFPILQSCHAIAKILLNNCRTPQGSIATDRDDKSARRSYIG